MPRLGLGLGLAKGSVLPTIDAEALALYNRVIADGGIIPAGLDGCNNYIKAAKAARGISTLAQGYLSLAHPHYTGIRLATGTGPTAGNRAARTVYNALGSTGDFIQTTAANQPLALVHSGTNYFFQPGISGNFLTSPNSTANQITGIVDFDYCFEVQLNNSCCFGKINTNGSAPSYACFVSNSNIVQYIDSTGSYINLANISPFLPSVGNLFWVRITLVNTTATCFTSSDGTNWTSRGSNTVTSLTSTTTAPLVFSSGSLVSNSQKSYRMRIYNGLRGQGGTLIADCNLSEYNRATSQTSWESSTGEVWTLNTPATNNDLKAEIVDTTMIMGNGTSYGMQAASLNIDQPAITSYTAFRKYVNSVGAQIINELSANYNFNNGKILGINSFENQEEIGIKANVGVYNSRFTSTNLGLKLATAVNNINNANESSPYLINNSSQTFVTSDSIANNTANMNATGYNLLARNNASSLWANVLMVADAVCIDELDNTQMTSMYNFFKTYINGI